MSGSCWHMRPTCSPFAGASRCTMWLTPACQALRLKHFSARGCTQHHVAMPAEGGTLCVIQAAWLAECMLDHVRIRVAYNTQRAPGCMENASTCLLQTSCAFAARSSACADCKRCTDCRSGRSICKSQSGGTPASSPGSMLSWEITQHCMMMHHIPAVAYHRRYPSWFSA